MVVIAASHLARWIDLARELKSNLSNDSIDQVQMICRHQSQREKGYSVVSSICQHTHAIILISTLYIVSNKYMREITPASRGTQKKSGELAVTTYYPGDGPFNQKYVMTVVHGNIPNP